MFLFYHQINKKFLRVGARTYNDDCLVISGDGGGGGGSSSNIIESFVYP